MEISTFLSSARLPRAILMCIVCGLVAFFQQAYGASAVSVPAEGKALIVFVRPEPDQSFYLYARTVLFEVKDETTNPEAIAILASKRRVMHQTTPGKHLFMIVGEKAEFMTADVVAGMTYYVTVLTQVGNRSAHYTFRVVDREQQASREFKELITTSTIVDNKTDSINWATANMPRVRKMQSQDYPTWAAKPESQRSSLLPIHGVGGHSRPVEGGASATAVIQVQPTVQTTEEKLKELKRLNDAGLISKEVYLEQQRAILSKP